MTVEWCESCGGYHPAGEHSPQSDARFEDSPEHGKLFVGWEPRECGEHRTVGDYRAWCFDCTEWCYSRSIDMACKGCEIVWLRARVTPPVEGRKA